MIKGLALLAVGDAVLSVRRKAIAYGLFAGAALVTVFALGYALNALHVWLSVNYSPMLASLYIAGGLLVIAAIIGVVGMMQKNAKPAAPTAATVSTAAMVAAAPAAARAMTTRGGAGAMLTLGVVALGAMLGRRMVK